MSILNAIDQSFRSSTILRPTTEQQNAIDLANTGQTMKITAYAGTGKTSTLSFIAKEFQAQGKRGYYLAFNKAIAEESKEKMPKNVTCCTMHSLAFRNTPNYIKDRMRVDFPIWEFKKYFNCPDTITVNVLPKTGSNNTKTGLNNEQSDTDNTDIMLKDVMSLMFGDVDDDSQTYPIATKPKKTKGVVGLSISKQRAIVDKALNYFYRDKPDVKAPDVSHVKRAIKAVVEQELTEDSIQHLCDVLLPIATTLWNDYTNPYGKIGMKNCHDVYLRLWVLSMPQISADFILFDEAQDTDPLMIALLEMQSCQIIYVGDANQQIYEFRGAINVMQRLELPETTLSQSFRFGNEIASRANLILESLGNAIPIKGLSSIDSNVHVVSLNDVQDKVDVYLTYTNAEAVRVVANSILKAKQTRNEEYLVYPVNIDLEQAEKVLLDMERLEEGKEVSHPKLKGFTSFEEMEEFLKFNSNLDLELRIYYDIYKDIGVEETVMCLHALSGINQKDYTGAIVTTTHRAKGLEWDSVAVCDDVFYSLESYIEKVNAIISEYEREVLFAIEHEQDIDDEIIIDESGNMVRTEPETPNIELDENGEIYLPDMVKERIYALMPKSAMRVMYVGITRAKKNLYLAESHFFLKDLRKLLDRLQAKKAVN